MWPGQRERGWGGGQVMQGHVKEFRFYPEVQSKTPGDFKWLRENPFQVSISQTRQQRPGEAEALAWEHTACGDEGMQTWQPGLRGFMSKRLCLVRVPFPFSCTRKGFPLMLCSRAEDLRGGLGGFPFPER